MRIKIKRRKNITSDILMILIALNSISGIIVCGISFNLMCNLLIGIVIAFTAISDKAIVDIMIRNNDYYLMYCISALCSCIFSYLYGYNAEGYKKVVASFAINAIYFCVIDILVENVSKSTFETFYTSMKRGIVFAAKFQGIWGLLQIFLLYVWKINLNALVLGDILHIGNVENTVWGFWTGTKFSLRITGLTNENSFFALIECLGVVLCPSIYWKVFFVVVTILSLSRTGWIMLLVILSCYFYLHIKRRGLSLKYRTIVHIILGIILVVALLIVSQTIRYQLMSIILRIQDPASHSQSAFRHFMYYHYGIDIWINDCDLIQKLFGYGMRCSGIAFNLSKYSRILPFTSGSYNVECDLVGLLLGGGLFTFVMYYSVLRDVYSSNLNGKIIALMLFAAGITYTFHANSYVLTVLMLFCNVKHKNIKTL